jgi:hypothetical protein
MLASELSYIGNVLLMSTSAGMFFAGKRKGKHEAQTETITTLESLVKALKDKVELLEQDKREQGLLIEKQNVWIEYLKGMVTGANPQLVPPGTLPDLHGSGRGGGAADPAAGGDG